MGVNLQKAAQKTFEKHTDRAIEDVSNGDLFDQDLRICPRRFFAEPASQDVLCEGDTVALELDGETLIGTRGPLKVFEAPTAPASIANNVRASGGIAFVMVVAVTPFSRTVEVELCKPTQ